MVFTATSHMPKIRRENVPEAVLRHLYLRLKQRRFTVDQLVMFADWLDQGADVPDGGPPGRHTLGTHAALFGVNPWRLQAWLGHKRIDETMLYVHVAEDHRREIPAPILAAGETERDPDQRILRMLGARGSGVAVADTPEMKKAAVTAA